MPRTLHTLIAEWKGLSGPRPSPSADELASEVEEYVGNRDGDMDAIDAAMFELVAERLRGPSLDDIEAAIAREESALRVALTAKGYEFGALQIERKAAEGKWTVWGRVRRQGAEPFSQYGHKSDSLFTSEKTLSAAIRKAHAIIAAVDDSRLLAPWFEDVAA